MKKNSLWGIVLILVGVIIGLNKLDIISFNIFFDGWWSLFIIIPCLVGIFTDKDKMGNIIGLLVGVLLLLGCNDVIDFDIVLSLLFPIVLVLIGISIIIKNISGSKIEVEKISDDNNYISAFSSQKVNIDSKYLGSKIQAIFGGVELNLDNAKIDKDIEIEVCAIFGGVDIIVPNDVNVKFNTTSIFGGCSDKRKNINKDDKKTIYINGICLFGGVDIK